jgi:hypothetical protein
MRRTIVAALAVAGVATAGCSSSHPAATVPSAPNAAPAQGVVTTDAAAAKAVAAAKWWQNGSGYCGMLEQTLKAGKSILPNASASDPTLHGVTTAFISDLERVAPANVAPSWKVLGDLIIKLVQANGDPSAVKGVDVAKVQAAVAAVSTDAKSRCGVKLAPSAH